MNLLKKNCITFILLIITLYCYGLEPIKEYVKPWGIKYISPQEDSDSLIGSNKSSMPNDSLKAPLFNTIDINGDSIRLKDYIGKVIVLNFWNTRCKNCLIEKPLLNDLVKKYQTRNVIFIAITEEKRLGIEAFFRNNGSFLYRQITDGANIIDEYVKAPLKAKTNDIFSFKDVRPAHVIINKLGQVVGYSWGASGEYPEWIDKKIEELLSK